MTDTVDRYAVFGNPVAHSKSPQIHALFASQTNQLLTYVAQQVEPGHFNECVDQFASEGGKGLNITVPFKEEAWRIAHPLSERAQLAGAVNTIKIEGDRYFGDNTDGVGLVQDLASNLHINLSGQRVLILGAGGAVRGVLGPILEQNPSELVIANRTVSKALNLSEIFAASGSVLGCSLEDLENNKPFNVVINGTSASLQGELPPLPNTLFDTDACAYDMMYGPGPTPFMQWALNLDVHHVHDGLGMLVEQAAESFYIWRDVRPETEEVIKKIRASLK